MGCHGITLLAYNWSHLFILFISVNLPHLKSYIGPFTCLQESKNACHQTRWAIFRTHVIERNNQCMLSSVLYTQLIAWSAHIDSHIQQIQFLSLQPWGNQTGVKEILRDWEMVLPTWKIHIAWEAWVFTQNNMSVKMASPYVSRLCTQPLTCEITVWPLFSHKCPSLFIPGLYMDT